jgi:hypothetical protein
MRCLVVGLLALSACSIQPLNGPPADITFLSTSVSPTVVAAGGQFIAAADVQYDNCNNPSIGVEYSGKRVEQSGAALRSTLTAVLDDTLVFFSAYCAFAHTGRVAIDIHVTPVP